MTLFINNIVISFEQKIYLILYLVIVILTVPISYSNPQYFIRYIGPFNPLYVIIISGIIGFTLLTQFLSKNGLAIFKKAIIKNAFRYFSAVMLFTVIAILVDCTFVFPLDMNVPFPYSFLFYPTMAFLVEIVFHVIPIATVLFLLTAIFKNFDKEKLIWISIFIVALIEPTFQIAMDDYPAWALLTTWINLFLFNLTQLIIFKNYGFISMFFFRLGYYLIWHIVWGHFRLELLF